MNFRTAGSRSGLPLRLPDPNFPLFTPESSLLAERVLTEGVAIWCNNPASFIPKSVTHMLTINRSVHALILSGLALTGVSLTLAQPATQVDIAPPDLGNPAGTYTRVVGGTSSISGYGAKSFVAVSDAEQPGDVLTFAYDELTGDFDKQVRIVGLSSDPADPVDNWTRGGLMVRSATSPDGVSLKLVAGNPAGANEVRLIGRGKDGQNYTTYSRTYSGVAAALPNQWLRLRRVGDYFAAYVKGANTSWALIGERYQDFPDTVRVGVYAAAATAGTKATLQFADYGSVAINDTTAPLLVSGGTIDKKLVGLKFSEAIDSATAAATANYAISQGTITGAKMGIGGDSVYLAVSGLTADDFTVTILGGLKDHAGNAVASGSTVNVKALNWFNADSGFIQNPAARPTAGDDPYREGEAVAVSSDKDPEFELIGGGSNIWDGGDYMHYIYTQIAPGDFDYAIEVSRYDRPANTAGWGNSGIHVRPSVYRTDDPVGAPPNSQDGTKVNNIAEVTYMEAGAPGRAGIGIWRMEPGGNYGAGGTINLTQEIGGLVGAYGRLRAKDSVGTPMDKTSPTQGIWLRMQRTGTTYRTYVSYNGIDWVNSVTQDRPDLGGAVLLGFATHNDTGGSPPPNNGYANNGYLPGSTDQDPNQNESNYTVQRVKIYPSGVPVPVPVDLTKVDLLPDGSFALAGTYTQSGTYSFDIAGGGTGAFRNMASDLTGGDEMTFAFEKITGDFDKQVRISSITSSLFSPDGTAYVPGEGEVLPLDNWARGGLMVRKETNAISANLKIVAGNPAGANQVVVQGRGLDGQRYTAFSRSYSGVTNNLPNQWLRMQRVGNAFSFYVSTDGVNWALVGQRFQDMPAEVYVGAYAASSVDPLDGTGNPNGLLGRATVKFADYKNVDLGDVVPPRLESVGTLDKKTIGVKFSEKVSSATATATGNYTLSQGTVASARLGVGGDAVYLTVNGLTADTFTVTVNGVEDPAGNAVAAGSAAQGRVTPWIDADIGFIQDPNARPTVGDDPYRMGESVALSSDDNPEFDIVGGGSNGWDPGDYMHYLHAPITGDFDIAVEVSRYDRAANTAGWGNSGIHVRPSLYRTDDPGNVLPYTQDGTKVNNLLLTTYMEGSAPGRAGIGIWRETAGGGYGAGGVITIGTEIGGLVGAFGDLRAMDASGVPMDKTVASQNIWLRLVRTGSSFRGTVSYNGTDWLESFTATREDLAGPVLVGFSTHNDTGGGAPPTGGYAGNGHEIDPGDPLNPSVVGNVQNESNYTVQRIRVYPAGPVVGPPGPLSIAREGAGITIAWPGTGILESAPTVGGPWNEVSSQTNPYTVTPSGTIYYRLKR